MKQHREENQREKRITNMSDIPLNAKVQCSDGARGESGAITHIQMREGHLWGKKDVAIPVGDIDFNDGKTVYLKIDKDAVKALPAVEVKR